MCNLYDIGSARRNRGDRWEASLERLPRVPADGYARRKTDPCPVVLRQADGPWAMSMRWGFERPYNLAVNNARLEQLDGPWERPWRERRRCLIPLSAWYEWHGPTGHKQTFAFVSTDGSWLWAAGIWEEGTPGASFAMLTRPAAPGLSFVHDRMPALLAPEDFDAYFTEENPRDLVARESFAVSVFRCHNPLLRLSTHRGPEPIEMLPGF